VGGPPPGRYFRQAFRADWNCGEPGLAPVTATPKSEMTSFPVLPAEPREAWSPCDLRHVMSAVVLGFEGDEFGVVRVVDGRLATDDGFEPPQPAAITTVPTRQSANTNGRRDTRKRKPTVSKPPLNRF
jgi:hypothetical protein